MYVVKIYCPMFIARRWVLHPIEKDILIVAARPWTNSEQRNIKEWFQRKRKSKFLPPKLLFSTYILLWILQLKMKVLRNGFFTFQSSNERVEATNNLLSNSISLSTLCLTKENKKFLRLNPFSHSKSRCWCLRSNFQRT
jgi:hypothetical protein